MEGGSSLSARFSAWASSGSCWCVIAKIRHCATFAGTVPATVLGGIVVGQWIVKVLYEAAATPLTYAAVAWLKANERIDTYDYGTDFNPIQL